MRILVLSDIHANFTALAAALEMARDRWDHIACLGDVVGYGPDPNEVVNQIQGVATTIIRGNHDKAAAGLTDLEDFNPVAGQALAWTRENLLPATASYLLGLPSGPVEADGLALVHGLLSFLFNTVILALSINLASGLL